MLQIAYFLAKIGADTDENERNFAEILPKTGNYDQTDRVEIGSKWAGTRCGPDADLARRPATRCRRAREPLLLWLLSPHARSAAQSGALSAAQPAPEVALSSAIGALLKL